MLWFKYRTCELLRTIISLLRACDDWAVINLSFRRRLSRACGFAFLVHPRSGEFLERDVYGLNDIYRPFPALRWLTVLLPKKKAVAFIEWFARNIVPITLSRISVCDEEGNRLVRGVLLSTVRTPQQLVGDKSAIRSTKPHLKKLFELALGRKVGHVGLGALIPSMTQYGKLFLGNTAVSVSTGHGFTAYTIVEFLRTIAEAKSAGRIARVAIVGAAGSTGVATFRMICANWNSDLRVDLMLVDTEKNAGKLQKLAVEAEGKSPFVSISTKVELSALLDRDFIVVVTNATGALIRPEHVRPGAVLIDDSQPRNTAPELVEHGCFVVDVLARINGLRVNFDFGFKTSDRSVTFTCLAETALVPLTKHKGNLAVGEVTAETIEQVLQLTKVAHEMRLIGQLPWFSFGREFSKDEHDTLLSKSAPNLRPLVAAE